LKGLQQLRGDLNTPDLSKKEMLEKFLDMVQQLSKRLAIDGRKVHAVQIRPAITEELTQHVLSIEEILQFQNLFHWLQAEAQKKTIMIDELKIIIILQESHHRTIESAGWNVERLFDDTQVDNECSIENMS
jgi:hypothetical protein